MPNPISKGLEKLKESLQAETPCLKVCMMGPRGVGKTTILTAVFNEAKDQICDTQLKLIGRGDTEVRLLDRKRQLSSVFESKEQFTDTNLRAAGLKATAAESTFDFAFGLLGKDPKLNMEIKDFRGETVHDDPERVKSFINDSAAILLAIDTPMLMENKGEFHEHKNQPQLITLFFRDTLPNIQSEKLIMLIPLKCERYAHDGRMKEVLTRVETAYQPLIELCRNNPLTCCAVAPIQTLGGVEFDRIGTDEKGNVKFGDDGFPEVIYRYTQEAKYEPLFCAQPLYATLSFLFKQYTDKKAKASIWQRLRGGLFNLFDNDKKLFEEMLKLEKHRLRDNPALGYKVECNSDRFFYDH